MQHAEVFDFSSVSFDTFLLFALSLYHMHNTNKYSLICICTALASLFLAAWLSQTSLCCNANTLMVAKNRSTFVSLVWFLTFAIFFVGFLLWHITSFVCSNSHFWEALMTEIERAGEKQGISGHHESTAKEGGEQFCAKFGKKVGKGKNWHNMRRSQPEVFRQLSICK